VNQTDYEEALRFLSRRMIGPYLHFRQRLSQRVGLAVSPREYKALCREVARRVRRRKFTTLLGSERFRGNVQNVPWSFERLGRSVPVELVWSQDARVVLTVKALDGKGR
jgi:hypothetical protein